MIHLKRNFSTFFHSYAHAPIQVDQSHASASVASVLVHPWMDVVLVSVARDVNVQPLHILPSNCESEYVVLPTAAHPVHVKNDMYDIQYI